METVSFLPDWYTNTNYTGLYVAQARGYFRDMGLAVTIPPFPPDHRVDRAVAAGQADFGICYQEQITMVRATERLPIVSIAAIMQHNTTGFSRPPGERHRAPARSGGQAVRRRGHADLPRRAWGDHGGRRRGDRDRARDGARRHRPPAGAAA